MVGVHVLSVIHLEFEPQSDQTNNYKIVICCFSAKNAALGERTKSGWLGIRIMCPSGATCLPADCSVSYHGKNQIKHVGLIQTDGTSSSLLIKAITVC